MTNKPTTLERNQPRPQVHQTWAILNSNFHFKIKSIGAVQAVGELLDGHGTKREVDILFLERLVSIDTAGRSSRCDAEDENIEKIAEIGGHND